MWKKCVYKPSSSECLFLELDKVDGSMLLGRRMSSHNVCIKYSNGNSTLMSKESFDYDFVEGGAKEYYEHKRKALTDELDDILTKLEGME